MVIVRRLLSLICLLPVIGCDELFVINAPTDGLAFSDKPVDIKASELGSLLESASGITSSRWSWNGLRVLSPFRYPSLVSLLVVQDGEGLPLDDSWKRFPLVGSTDSELAFHQLDRALTKLPHTLPAIKLETGPEEEEQRLAGVAAPAGSALNASRPADRRLLAQLGLLDSAAGRLTEQLAGRRAVLLWLDALPGLRAEYGPDSAELPAAGAALTDAMRRYGEAVRSGSDGLALTLLLVQPAPSRRGRSLLAADDPTPAPGSQVNLASSYSADYPVIFNILLITSLLLAYLLVSFSLMMAYMDPGKDSIIYRMTNPNMKKNN